MLDWEVVGLWSASYHTYVRMYGDCTSDNGRIRENVGLYRCPISKVSLYTYVYEKFV